MWQEANVDILTIQELLNLINHYTKILYLIEFPFISLYNVDQGKFWLVYVTIL